MSEAKNREQKIVFTNGVFDILHPGHIQVLKFAKSLGDKLIVGINSDRAVKILKGEDRPVNNELARKTVLELLDLVDKVVIFDDVKTFNIVRELKPDIVVKGDEGYTAEQVRERDQIPSEIEIKLCPKLADYSTTNIIKKIKKNSQDE